MWKRVLGGLERVGSGLYSLGPFEAEVPTAGLPGAGDDGEPTVDGPEGGSSSERGAPDFVVLLLVDVQ